MPNTLRPNADLDVEVGWRADPVPDLQADVRRLDGEVRALAQSVAGLRAETIDLRMRFESTVCDMSDLHRQTARAFSDSTSQQFRANLSLARNTMRAGRALPRFGLLAAAFFCVVTPPAFVIHRQWHDATRYVTTFPEQGPFGVSDTSHGKVEAVSSPPHFKPGDQVAWTLRVSLRPDVSARATWRIFPRDGNRALDTIVRYVKADPSGEQKTITQAYTVPENVPPGDYRVTGYIDIYPEGHGRVSTPREGLTPIEFQVAS